MDPVPVAETLTPAPIVPSVHRESLDGIAQDFHQPAFSFRAVVIQGQGRLEHAGRAVHDGVAVEGIAQGLLHREGVELQSAGHQGLDQGLALFRRKGIPQIIQACRHGPSGAVEGVGVGVAGGRKGQGGQGTEALKPPLHMLRIAQQPVGQALSLQLGADQAVGLAHGPGPLQANLTLHQVAHLPDIPPGIRRASHKPMGGSGASRSLSNCCRRAAKNSQYIGSSRRSSRVCRSSTRKRMRGWVAGNWGWSVRELL